MTRLPRVSSAVLPVALLLVLLPGCETVKNVWDSIQKPSARVVGADIVGLGLNGLELAFDVEINNPYDLPLPLLDMGYSLASRGSEFLQGTAALQGTVPARDRKVISLPAKVNFAPLMDALSGVRLGAIVPYKAKLDLSVDAPGAGRINLPLDKEGELPIPSVPDVAIEEIQWQELSLDRAAANLNIRIRNTNQFPVSLRAMPFGLDLAGARVFDGNLSSGVELDAGQGSTLQIPMEFRPSSLGVALLNTLMGNDASYGLTGSLDLGTRFGDLQVPLAAAGRAILGK